MFLIRHFQTTHHGKFIGSLDPHIDRDEVGQFLAPNVTKVFASPSKRAVESAQLLFPAHPVEILQDIREIDYGLWEGLTWEEIVDQWPEISGEKISDWLGVTPPLGEPWNHFTERVLSALHQIEDPHASIAMVAHQGVNAVIYSHLTGSNPLEFTQGYGEVVEA